MRLSGEQTNSPRSISFSDEEDTDSPLNVCFLAIKSPVAAAGLGIFYWISRREAFN